MKRKKLDLCREFGCPRRTWSGEKEREISKRYCHFHSPSSKARQQRFKEKYVLDKTTQPKKTARLMIPLVCVFRPYEVVEDRRTGEVRVHQTTRSMCLAEAPRRRRGNRTLPRHPNRFGEPLCAAHARYRDDERAFPGEIPEGLVTSDEAEEERERALADTKTILSETNRRLLSSKEPACS